MAIQILPNQIKIGQYVLQESSTGISFSGNVKAADFVSLPYAGSVTGFASAGTGPSNVIDKFPFAVDASATDAGDLAQARDSTAGHSSTTHGYISGGSIFPARSDNISKFPFATTFTTTTTVGVLGSALDLVTGTSSKLNEVGFTTAGRSNPSTFNASIFRFPFATDAGSSTTGSITVGRRAASGQSSLSHGYTSGGYLVPDRTNVIDKFPFATGSESTDVGDLTGRREHTSGNSSSVSGYVSGGYEPPIAVVSTINKFPFATDANATTMGTGLSLRGMSGQDSQQSGYQSGGINPPQSFANIAKFPFATDANTSSVGNLTVARGYASGQSY